MLIKSGSLEGYNFIKRKEGIKLIAYQCSAEVWTIGYGHIKNVKEGDIITYEQADEFFFNDIKLFENKLNEAIVDINPFTQHQYDSLLSLAYNCGISAIYDILVAMKKNISFDKIINVSETSKFNQYKFHIKNNRNEILYYMVLFCKWISANGKPVEGLYNRRIEECINFLNIA